MRTRLAILPVLLVAVVALLPATAIASSGHHIYLTQADPGGADKGQSEDGTAEVEAGPLWTYQMARISLALLLLTLLGAGWWYYRFVVRRQRGEI